MKFKFKIILRSFLIALCFLSATSIKALADGPPYQEVEINNSASDANQIVLYDSVNGTLPRGDMDYFKIFIPTTDTYEFYFKVTNGTKSINVTMNDANNNTVFQGKADINGYINFGGNFKGLYYVVIKDEQNLVSNNEYNFEFYPKDGQNNNLYRFGGNDRYDTSLNIFKSNWVSCDYALITTGEDFADALSAAPLAKKYNAPVILTKPDALSIDMESQINKAGVKNIFIIGGIGAISKDIENKIISMGITVNRIQGADRYSTSLEIAKYLNPKGEAVIATGENFPDALSVAPIAASNEMPILLVNKNRISSEVTKYIKDNGIKKTYIIGGDGVISTEYENYISRFTTVKRLYGSNRYKTNINVLTFFQDRLKLSEIYYATGLNFPDALSGSVLAAAGNHPIVLVDKNPDISTIKFSVKNLELGKCVFGGQAVLPDNVIQDLTNN